MEGAPPSPAALWLWPPICQDQRGDSCDVHLACSADPWERTPFGCCEEGRGRAQARSQAKPRKHPHAPRRRVRGGPRGLLRFLPLGQAGPVLAVCVCTKGLLLLAEGWGWSQSAADDLHVCPSRMPATKGIGVLAIGRIGA